MFKRISISHKKNIPRLRLATVLGDLFQEARVQLRVVEVSHLHSRISSVKGTSLYFHT